ncbi:MAG: DUF2512 family protein [Alkalibacterium sp.]|nr:DUF2512 family protein [Alkalibacterium sp.]
MKHVKALALKLIALIVLSFIVLYIIFELPFNAVFITAVITSVVIYVLGDLVVLKSGGNFVAVLVDAGTTFALSWIYLASVTDEEVIVASFVFAVAVGLFESLFHYWLLSSGFTEER